MPTPYDHWSEIQMLIKTNVTNMALQLDGQTIPVVLRKLPTKQDTIDPNTQIVVAPDEAPPLIQRFAFQIPGRPAGVAKVTYYSIIAIITSNNLDNQKNIPVYTAWLQQVSEYFSSPAGLVGITGLKDCRAKPLKFLDRSKMKVGYDYLGIQIAATVTKSLVG